MTRCDYSDLYETECAHCRGDELPFGIKEGWNEL